MEQNQEVDKLHTKFDCHKNLILHPEYRASSAGIMMELAVGTLRLIACYIPYFHAYFGRFTNYYYLRHISLVFSDD